MNMPHNWATPNERCKNVSQLNSLVNSIALSHRSSPLPFMWEEGCILWRMRTVIRAQEPLMTGYWLNFSVVSLGNSLENLNLTKKQTNKKTVEMMSTRIYFSSASQADSRCSLKEKIMSVLTVLVAHRIKIEVLSLKNK